MLERVNDILSFKEAMELLGVGKGTLYELIRRNEIEAFRVGTRWKILKISIIDYIKNQF